MIIYIQENIWSRGNKLMAYYFMVQNKKGQFTPLNISKSPYFYLNRTYNKDCAYSLMEIDCFTTLFENEQQLRNHLLTTGILLPFDGGKELSIRIIKNGKYHKVYYDFLYQKDYQYLEQPNNLIKDIQVKKYDLNFLLSLANHYISNYQCKTTASDLRFYVSNSIQENTRSKYLDLLDENSCDILTRLCKLLIYPSKEYYDYEKQCYLTKFDTTNVNYSNFHSLIAFKNHYELSHDLTDDFSPLKKDECKKLIKKPTPTSMKEEQVEQLRLF